MNYRITVIVLLTALLAGCSGMVFDAPTSTATQTASPLPPTATATVTLTPSITPTFTQAPTLRLRPGYLKVLVMFKSQYFCIIILLVSPSDSEYYVPPRQLVPPDRFDDQMKLLHNWGYTTITTSMLVNVITKGASLPPRPIIIAFDDS